MKKVVYVLLGFLLVIIMVAGVGCTKAATPAPAPAPIQTITGTVTGNPVVGPAGNQTITINTPSGPQIYPVNPVAATTFAGQACTLDQVNQKVADNVTYNCTVVTDSDQGVVAVYINGP